MPLAIFGANATEHASWTPSPNGRGTWDILSSCIITLLLCVYNAIHLNIPPIGASNWWKVRKKLKWLLIALVAPEFVAFNAWRQRSEAAYIVEELRKKSGQPRPASSIRRALDVLRRRKPSSIHAETPKREYDEPIYTLVHGFYIVMGGIVIDVTDDSDRLWSPEIDVLTVHSVSFLKVYDLVGDRVRLLESAGMIKDKSKQDGLTKTMVCIQALWFCVQFLSRISQSLTVSILELNTFAHAICALLIYLLWWDKPSGVEGPTVFKARDSIDIHDLSAVCDPRNVDWPKSSLRVWLGNLDVFMHKCCYQFSRGLPVDFYFRLEGEREIADGWSDFDKVPYRSPTITRRCDPTSCFPGRIPAIPSFRRLFERSNISDNQHYLFTSYDPPLLYLKRGDPLPGGRLLHVDSLVEFVELDEYELARLQRIDQLLVQQRLDPHSHKNYMEDIRLSAFEHNLQVHELEISHKGTLSGRKTLQLAMSLAGFLYGGLHALVWGSSALRTTPENVLWNISCISIISTGPAFALHDYLNYHTSDMVSWLERSFRAILSLGILRKFLPTPARFPTQTFLNMVYYVRTTGGFVVFLVYIFSRVYLIVEVFINVAYLPPSAFGTPNWTLYFPHVS